ncbi:hypothetical protein B0H17DRAFT_1034905 [Mycena rosella]|uniref:D-aminoacyl-tRNA deacylase n=1 Tax=Mycena rosella TaxID=1033263 RepID=A0AAD7GWR6_MYCRO|nr:hypothetical protein B0H17DRAFT_1034905 [Mycena rosella]
MRAVVQRVASASLGDSSAANGQVISQISGGSWFSWASANEDLRRCSIQDLEIFNSLSNTVDSDDAESDFSTLTNKLYNAETSIKDVDGTSSACLAETRKGNKPDFHNAMSTEQSRVLYETSLETLRRSYRPEKIQGNGTLLPLYLSVAHMIM